VLKCPRKVVRAATLNMNAQPHQPFPQNKRIYPQSAKPQDTAEKREPERQAWGTIVSIICILIEAYSAYTDVVDYSGIPVMMALRVLARLSYITFQVLAVTKADYLAGKPSFLALTPGLASHLFIFLSDTYYILNTPILVNHRLIFSVLLNFIAFTVTYFMYSADDDSGSCCLCFKPWVYKRPVATFIPGYPQYPPQPAYYPQGYPPQQQAYPPQQQAYPPQQQAYPPQGYPPQGHPNV
jgi:hypothetical protein